MILIVHTFEGSPLMLPCNAVCGVRPADSNYGDNIDEGTVVYLFKAIYPHGDKDYVLVRETFNQILNQWCAVSGLTPYKKAEATLLDTDDYVVCLEDNKKLKMLKRHLKNEFNMTLAEYRIKWGLPKTYKGVALNYAKKRSELAKKHGLGVRA